ncbi:MAG: nucleoside triphosphate pyrophosphohydrolase [Halanaerobiaceae bacterium]
MIEDGLDKDKLKEELERLVNIMERLRGPDGCPWDREQDLYSLQPYIVEEAYEVVEAMQKKDLKLLREELGDLLLQVVFQSQIAREEGEFTLTEVIKGISNKLIRRHPHVFADERVDTSEQVKILWNEVKREEKGKSSILDELSGGQPALNQAYELQTIAAGVGFDWDEIKQVLAKVREEISEIEEAINRGSKEEAGHELGDLLFAAVNLARFLKSNPELELLRTINKFKKRFNYIESRVREKGKNIEKVSLQELDDYWEEAKLEK